MWAAAGPLKSMFESSQKRTATFEKDVQSGALPFRSVFTVERGGRCACARCASGDGYSPNWYLFLEQSARRMGKIRRSVSQKNNGHVDGIPWPGKTSESLHNVIEGAWFFPGDLWFSNLEQIYLPVEADHPMPLT